MGVTLPSVVNKYHHRLTTATVGITCLMTSGGGDDDHPDVDGDMVTPTQCCHTHLPMIRIPAYRHRRRSLPGDDWVMTPPTTRYL